MLNNKIDPIQLVEKISFSANQAVSFFESKLNTENGSFGSNIIDLSCYFKSPMMFIAAGKNECALKVLRYIKKTFMIEDGDFKTNNDLKSSNQAYIEYWSYTNGWILRAANILNENEIVESAQKYLKNYDRGENKGFFTNKFDDPKNMTDVLTVAHHGLIYLETHDINKATDAANFLCQAFEKQKSLDNGFYLRIDEDNNLITDFNDNNRAFYFIDKNAPNQLHFMIGYPAAFLAILYKKTSETKYLDAAKKYLDFSLNCHDSVYSCEFSHKIAWAASLLYECTGEEKYLSIINKICDYFINKQKNGVWFDDDVNKCYDQSAEIACWFLDIVKNIENFEKNHTTSNKIDNKNSWELLTIGSIALVLSGIGLYALCRKNQVINNESGNQKNLEYKNN